MWCSRCRRGPAPAADFNAKGKQLVPAGRRLVLELPGGGWGDPARRPSELVERDALQGYV